MPRHDRAFRARENRKNAIVKLAASIIAAAVLAFGAAAASAQARAATDPNVFAVVGDVVLSSADFHAAYNVAARTKFYHAKPPEEEIAVFQREVGAELVNRVLVVKEARRRGLKPDRDQVQAQLTQYEARAKASPAFAANRAALLAAMREQFENQSLYEQMERQMRKAPAATDAQARAYYTRHVERFVEPEQVRVAVILLKVDPSAPRAAWDAARAEADKLYAKLKGGADFAALAKLHSGDATADKGGDMGYLHRGMLPDGVHSVVDKLRPGQTAEPVTLLEGVAILRLEDRKSAQQRSFEDVRARAGELWQREEEAARWQKFVADLRQATPVKVNESLYLPLGAPKEKSRPG
jgi:parvulin-like peptidyl-prolyl isomerase